MGYRNATCGNSKGIVCPCQRPTSALSQRHRALATVVRVSPSASSPGSDSTSALSRASTRVRASPSLTVRRRRRSRSVSRHRAWSTTSPKLYGLFSPLTIRPRSRGTIANPGLTGDSPIWNPAPSVVTGFGAGGPEGYAEVCARWCCERRRYEMPWRRVGWEIMDGRG